MVTVMLLVYEIDGCKAVVIELGLFKIVLLVLTDEIVSEFAQQDQEYTVDYSIPSQVAAAAVVSTSRTHPAKISSHLPPHTSTTSSERSPKPHRQISDGRHLDTSSHKETPRSHRDGKNVDSASYLNVSERLHIDRYSVSDSDRPVPKPRYVSSDI